tara:strand:- start:6439 stop:6627 length:189 start_codon:yes stop_codon:yes gene_type:complete
MKNGIYENNNVTYFIYNNKILMLLNGNVYKTNKNFMQGQYKEDLSKDMISQFDKVYNEVKSW